MLGLDTLDVAIGLVFVYLMVSFVCSAGVELVEVFLKNRPKKLLEGITELLGQSDTLVKKIYGDPLVNSLYKGKFGELPPTKLPSYIPARNFALAVLNQLPGAGGSPSWDKLNMSVDGFFTDNDRAQLAALRETPAAETELEKKARLAQTLELQAKQHIATAVKSALLTAEGDIEKAVKGIEDWYNSSMDRVSGWFKRRTQYILLGFGIVCAIMYNVDTIAIVRKLATDKAVRSALVASAGAAVNEGQATAAGAPAKPDETTAEAKDRWTKSLQKLESTHLPIGWGDHPVFDSALIAPAVREHGLGWLLSAIAVSFGAPFWFDILNKFMVVRSTVKPKEKSGTEKSKDK